MTRGKRLVVLVGRRKALAIAVKGAGPPFSPRNMAGHCRLVAANPKIKEHGGRGRATSLPALGAKAGAARTLRVAAPRVRRKLVAASQGAAGGRGSRARWPNSTETLQPAPSRGGLQPCPRRQSGPREPGELLAAFGRAAVQHQELLAAAMGVRGEPAVRSLATDRGSHAPLHHRSGRASVGPHWE